MSARSIRKIVRRRQRKRSGAYPLFGKIVADKIGKLPVDGDDFVGRTGQRSQQMHIGRVAWQEHPVTVAAADNRSRGHSVGDYRRMGGFGSTHAPGSPSERTSLCSMAQNTISYYVTHI